MYQVPAIPMIVIIEAEYVEIAVLAPISNSELLSWHASWYFDEDGLC